jgi:GNAT superfamily N-acetyltransferase
MDSILKNATTEQLGLAVQENLFALFRAMTMLSDSHLEETAYLSRHLTFPSNPMYKGAWNTHIPPEQTDDCIRETIDWFQSREAPFFFWWTGPGSAPDDLAHRLLAHGLIDLEGQSTDLAPGIKASDIGAPGMAADLYKVNEEVLEKIPPGFEIQDVQNETDLQDFKQVLVAGYEMPPPMADGWVQSARAFGIGKTPWRLVLGRLNGKPVATNIVLNGGGVAGLYGIAVVPSARNQGIGAAITLQPILEERDRQGYHYAVLFATLMGAFVYARIGFQLVETRIHRYLWRNA